MPAQRLTPPLRLCLIVESGTDVRLIEGLAERFQLSTTLWRCLEAYQQA